MMPLITNTCSNSQATKEALTEVIPRGVTSSMRTRRRPLIFQSGVGGHLVDLDGNEFVDCVLALGPIVIGHSEPSIAQRISNQLGTLVVSGAESAVALTLGTRVRQWLPHAERLTFVNTGSEAVHLALRVARGTTGRTKVLRFEGHYHGWIDPAYTNGMMLGPVETEAKSIPVRVNGGGQPDLDDQLVIARWNDADAFDSMFDAHGDELAAVIMEPIAFNMGGARAYIGYLEHVRDVCTRRGILLVFDEVVCGFRLGKGGAQGLLGIRPDLSTFAKALSSGVPLGMVTGTAAAMASLEDGRVNAVGTYNGNALSIAAGDATTELIDQITDFFTELAVKAAWLKQAIDSIANDLEVPMRANQTGSVLNLFWAAEGDLQTFGSCASSDAERIQDVMERMADHGVFALPRGTIFLCYRHSQDDLERIAEALRIAITESLQCSNH